MGVDARVAISKTTATFFANERYQHLFSFDNENHNKSTEYDLNWLLAILNAEHEIQQAKEQLFQETVRACILFDLKAWLSESPSESDELYNQSALPIRLKGKTLTIIGSVLAFLGGALGASVLLSFIPQLGLWVLGLGCLISGMLAVAVFYAFDRVQIANYLGEKKALISNPLDALEVQSRQLDLISDQIMRNLVKENGDKGDEYDAIILMLKSRYEAVEQALKSYQETRYHAAAKKVASVITGTLYFSAGFFIAQPALVLLSKFMLTSLLSGLAVTSWPAVAVGIVLGLCALALYWNCERPQLETFVRKVLGVDEGVLESCKKNLAACEARISDLQKVVRVAEGDSKNLSSQFK